MNEIFSHLETLCFVCIKEPHGWRCDSKTDFRNINLLNSFSFKTCLTSKLNYYLKREPIFTWAHIFSFKSTFLEVLGSKSSFFHVPPKRAMCCIKQNKKKNNSAFHFNYEKIFCLRIFRPSGNAFVHWPVK